MAAKLRSLTASLPCRGPRPSVRFPPPRRTPAALLAMTKAHVPERAEVTDGVGRSLQRNLRASALRRSAGDMEIELRFLHHRQEIPSAFTKPSPVTRRRSTGAAIIDPAQEPAARLRMRSGAAPLRSRKGVSPANWSRGWVTGDERLARLLQGTLAPVSCEPVALRVCDRVARLFWCAGPSWSILARLSAFHGPPPPVSTARRKCHRLLCGRSSVRFFSLPVAPARQAVETFASMRPCPCDGDLAHLHYIIDNIIHLQSQIAVDS
ncbi:hypothetical protein M011DRAFT_25252 [Sporormia fimetaria CBS 119925]|uniref:Uncharacterized protein n=1 Tax=Sporormia fimetaria CBS 119925 TaxID=1340428 RepID=A0A6A6VCS2_9PLEO|nr:hypothetical protein M011DRAFT_25252 [Sporormia fimetaria CBS 119925]